MSIEKLFFEKFAHFEVSPPANMWGRISAALESDKDKAIPYFSSLEKRFLTGSFFSLLLCSSILMQFTSTPLIKSEPHFVYTHPNPMELPKNVSSENSIPLRSNPLTTRKLSPASSKAVLSTISNYSNSNSLTEKGKNPLQESKKQIRLIRDLAILDKQIDSIEQIQWSEAKSLENIFPSPIEVRETKPLASNINEFPSKYLDPILPIEEEVKLESSSPFNFRGIYLTPYIGGNFTQVFYQGQPNNPYFSDKAIFTGKIGYNFGVQAGYQFNKHWSIESGVAFGQYIQSFRETFNQVERKGQMYIDQIDIPVAGRFSLHFGNDEYPKTFSFKSGLIYNSVTQYQVNYTDKNLVSKLESANQVDADKRLYNSLQLGYLLGFDFDAYISKKISLNLSMLNALVSQFDNFPFFKSDIHRPLQYSTTFTIGTKIRF